MWNMSEGGQRIRGAARRADPPQRRERKQEFPPAESVARLRERLQVAVVDEPQAHRDDPDGVNRAPDLLVAGRHRVLRGVTTDGRDTALAEPRETRRMPSGSADVRDVVATALPHFPPVTRAHQEDVTLVHADAVLGFAGLEIRGRHGLARLEPVLAAEPRDIEQHAARDDAPG